MKLSFRFYSNYIGFMYFDKLEAIPTKLTKQEFKEGNLNLVCNATCIAEIPVFNLIYELYN